MKLGCNEHSDGKSARTVGLNQSTWYLYLFEVFCLGRPIEYRFPILPDWYGATALQTQVTIGHPCALSCYLVAQGANPSVLVVFQGQFFRIVSRNLQPWWVFAYSCRHGQTPVCTYAYNGLPSRTREMRLASSRSPNTAVQGLGLWDSLNSLFKCVPSVCSGYLYEHGLGVPLDYAKALMFYDRARSVPAAMADVDQGLTGMPIQLLIFLAKIR